MSDALKRIEDQWGQYERDGIWPEEISETVVKLAQALDHALERMREEGCDCGTDEPGTCALCGAERTLKEVAGE